MRIKISSCIRPAIAFTIGIAISVFAVPVLMFKEQPKARAMWKENHTSLAGLSASADAIVAGEVIGIELGRTIPDDPHIQFMNVTLHTTDSLKGSGGGTDLTIEVVGDPRTASRPRSVMGVPELRPGERFLLFLKKQPIEPYLWYIINNQAGYRLRRPGIDGPEILHASDQRDRLASTLNRLTLPVALARIREALVAR